MFGYDPVDSAADGQQSVEMAEKTRYDVILMDLQMPIMDGMTAMSRIQASPLAGDPCIVILTADAQPVSIGASMLNDRKYGIKQLQRAASTT